MKDAIIKGLVSMKRAKEKVRLDGPIATMKSAGESFPYGLEVTLTTAELKALGLDMKDFEIDDTVNLIAEAKVKGINANGSDYGDGTSKEVRLQITKLKILGGKNGKK